MISLINNLEIIFVLIFFIIVKLEYFQRSGMLWSPWQPIVVLNKLLKSLRYFHVAFLSVVLRVKIFNLTIRDTNSKYCSHFDNFL
jgi:hypothetical protein